MGKVAAMWRLVCVGETGRERILWERQGRARTSCFVAVEDAEAGAEDGKEEELDDAAGNAVDSVNSTDLVGADAEAAREAEGEVCVGAVGDLAGVVEEDGEHLVVSYRVESQEGVRDEVDDGLVGEDLGVARTLSLGKRVRRFVGAGLREQRGRCLIINE